MFKEALSQGDCDEVRSQEDVGGARPERDLPQAMVQWPWCCCPAGQGQAVITNSVGYSSFQA